MVQRCSYGKWRLCLLATKGFPSLHSEISSSSYWSHLSCWKQFCSKQLRRRNHLEWTRGIGIWWCDLLFSTCASQVLALEPLREFTEKLGAHMEQYPLELGRIFQEGERGNNSQVRRKRISGCFKPFTSCFICDLLLAPSNIFLRCTYCCEHRWYYEYIAFWWRAYEQEAE